MNLKLFPILIFNFIAGYIYAQPFEHDRDMKRLNEVYNETINESAGIYSGMVYSEQAYLKKGSPFLLADSLSSGWLVYNGHYYPRVDLQWDGFQNYVLVRSLSGLNKVILDNDKIDSFSFAGHLVKNIRPDTGHNLMKGGLYDFIKTGSTMIIVKRKKDQQAEIEGMRVYYRFYETSLFYVRKEGTYYRVSNKKDVLVLYGKKHQSAIKREVRKSGLSWRKNFEQCLLMAAIYYDKVQKQV